MKFIKIIKDNIDIAHQMEKEIFPHYDAYNNYLDTFKKDSNNDFWIIEVDNTYVGIAGLYSFKKYPEDAWLGWFGLLKPYRNKGYGSLALKMFEEKARNRGFKYARLFTNRYDNDDAKRFYEKHGYTEEYYELESDPASLIYPISIYSKSLIEGEAVPKWNNKDIHFTKQVRKQQ